VDFPSVVHAVQCAQHIQAQFRTHNAEKEQDEQIHVRIGIHLGDIVQREGDVFGDAEITEALRLNPNLSLDTVKQISPYKNPADLERFLDGLRKAGLK